MRSYCLCVWLLLLPVLAAAAERQLSFSELHENQAPSGFRSTVTASGMPGEWKIILDDVPPLLAPLSSKAPTVAKRAVLAQLAQDPTDEHFPLLVFEEETFGDFTLTTRFKTVRGVMEQMAGIAFRIQNETNYYVVRASSLGNTFRFYKIVNGQRGTLIGPELPIARGVWHELSIECKGNQIRCQLDAKEVIPPLTDNTFARGKIGFWTKSDSISYFADTKIVYTPLEAPVQALLRELSKKYPRLLGLKVYVSGSAPQTTRLIASKDEKEVGQPGAKTEQAVISQGAIYYGKDKGAVSVIMPLRDRNGDTIAAVRVVMRPFTGQTEQNAIVRASPIVKEIQKGIQSLQDLIE